jgi:hypothetical protein
VTVARAGGSLDEDVDQLLSGLTRFLLLHSAEGAFELRDTVRAVAARTGRTPRSWPSPREPC